MQRTPYTLQDLRRTLSPNVVQRGQGYASRGQVHTRQYNGALDRYVARVNGSREDPYAVHAHVVRGRSGISVYGTCTCPMRINCKHVAAVLLDALAGGGSQSTQAPAPPSARGARAAGDPARIAPTRPMPP